MLYLSFFFFFFNDTATTEIYTLSLHDALPISALHGYCGGPIFEFDENQPSHSCLPAGDTNERDRKSTRLNSSHQIISYAVFCFKKKKKNKNNIYSTYNYFM